MWKDINSKDPTNGIMLSEIRYNRKYGNTEDVQVKVIYIKPITALHAIYKATGVKKIDQMFHDWCAFAKNRSGIFDVDNFGTPEKYFTDLKNALASKRKVIPIIVFLHHFNGPNTMNEGRHRSLAAYELGMKTIPVFDINKNYW